MKRPLYERGRVLLVWILERMFRDRGHQQIYVPVAGVAVVISAPGFIVAVKFMERELLSRTKIPKLSPQPPSEVTMKDGFFSVSVVALTASLFGDEFTIR